MNRSKLVVLFASTILVLSLFFASADVEGLTVTVAPVSLDKSEYTVGEQPIVTVTDTYSNFDPNKIDTIQVVVKAKVTKATVGTTIGTYTIQETGPNTRIFSGKLPPISPQVMFNRAAQQENTWLEVSYTLESTYNAAYAVLLPSEKEPSNGDYGGYASWDEYCRATYGSDYYYDIADNICYTDELDDDGEQQSDDTLNTPSIPSTHTPTLTGNYQGTAKWSASFDYYNGNLGSYRENCQYAGNIVLQLQRDGDHVSGNAEVTNYQVVGAIDTSTCQAGFDLSGAVDAIVFGSGFSGTVGVLDIDGQFTTDLLRGQISGNLGDAVDISGQFTASRVN